MPEIERREPPARTAAGGRRPMLPLDEAIIGVAQERALRPVSIAKALRAADGTRWAELTTQRVVSRLKALTARGTMVRIRPVDGPANGPGTSLYRVKRDSDSQS